MQRNYQLNVPLQSKKAEKKELNVPWQRDETERGVTTARIGFKQSKEPGREAAQ